MNPSIGTDSPRIDRITGDDASARRLLERLLETSSSGLGQMYREDQRVFAHTLRRDAAGNVGLEGTSTRYGAIVLLGALHLPEAAQAEIFAGEGASEYCGRLLASLDAVRNMGDLALAAWAAAELRHPDLRGAIERMLGAYAEQRGYYSVELAWVVSALVAAHGQCDARAELESAHDLLLGAFSEGAGVFPHVVGPVRVGWHRSHVACFADQVYPIQALARHHGCFGHAPSLAAANRCAERICELQGDAGQWWWHYDARNGRVIEGYPVYSVHQDAMGPMALLDLAEAGGTDFGDEIRLGLSWMHRAPEVGHSLIDEDQRVIWRKVARKEPRKLVRGIRAVASRLHEDLRLDLLDPLFPTTAIDYESRPYHLGWVLHAWLGCS